MGLYVLFSNQDKIRARKEEIQRLRVALAAAKDEYNETMRLSRRNLAASFGLLGVVVGPAVFSSLPLLIVIGWLAAHYGYVRPGRRAGADGVRARGQHGRGRAAGRPGAAGRRAEAALAGRRGGAALLEERQPGL